MAHIKGKRKTAYKLCLRLTEEDMEALLVLTSASATVPDHIRKINNLDTSNAMPATVGMLMHKIWLKQMELIDPINSEFGKESACKPTAKLMRTKTARKAKP